MRHDVEMDGIAADDAAERHHTLVGSAAMFRRLDRHGDRRWNLERAGHRDAIDRNLCRIERAHRAGEQLIGDVVVKARLDDENSHALERALVADLPARLGHGARYSAGRVTTKPI